MMDPSVLGIERSGSRGWVVSREITGYVGVANCMSYYRSEGVVLGRKVERGRSAELC